ncbi:hypothetical protein UFOVP35_25 [uncultured Caudovirales phage]|uniref:Uncharacterized protein n=1 Tax=uncultured Caudovirales phage TaxID=2100421 RepID=A0A6J5KR16_9CAUD|nr:hypothetical protein UFOVP35_25 [uncultured Caudovirales phage]CAB4124436.1 hypothetical protein UFOVP52_22 [uncultured Caudovirales phage]CAB5219852.1 hypothetical protein UFOVP234_47 [uncultured Caudovirales phage]
MILYIEIENGLPKNHPAFEENLLQAFPAIPLTWEKFVRVERPIFTNVGYKVVVGDNPTYEKVDGVWTDVWALRDMTAEEKAAKQQKVKDRWAALPQRDNFSDWIFNEETVKYEPPIPRPTDREVIWSGANNGWVDRPQKPDDGKEYKIDFYTSTWVPVTP